MFKCANTLIPEAHIVWGREGERKRETQRDGFSKGQKHRDNKTWKKEKNHINPSHYRLKTEKK